MQFQGSESVNIDGETSGLDFSWKIGNNKFFTSNSVQFRFDELGCFPVKLTVTSQDNKRSHSVQSYVQVENLKPTLSSITVSPSDINSDPVVVQVSAQ